jgi:hypothetical protein
VRAPGSFDLVVANANPPEEPLHPASRRLSRCLGRLHPPCVFSKIFRHEYFVAKRLLGATSLLASSTPPCGHAARERLTGSAGRPERSQTPRAGEYSAAQARRLATTTCLTSSAGAVSKPGSSRPGLRPQPRRRSDP